MGTVICSICKRREAFFFRPYSGEKLCKRCFAISIENKVRATIAKYNMLEYNDRIAVGVSGGKDSSSLLHILAKIEQNYPKSSLVAVTVDEGIRRYRDEALKIATENCKKLGIEHATLRLHVRRDYETAAKKWKKQALTMRILRRSSKKSVKRCCEACQSG